MSRHDSISSSSDLSNKIPAVVYQFLVTSKGNWKFIYISQRIEAIYEVTAEDALKDHEVMTSCILREDRPSHRHSVEQAVRNCAEWARVKVKSGVRDAFSID